MDISSQSSYLSSNSSSTWSSMSTPSKGGTNGLSKYTLDSLRPALRDELEDHIQAGVSIEHFVEHIWGVSSKDVATILGQAWSLDPIALKKYQKVIKHREHERNLYPPFVTIATSLLSATRKAFGYDSKNPIEFLGLGDTVIKNKFTTRKPDGLTMWPDSPTEWRFVQSIIEFKSKRVPQPEYVKDHSRSGSSKPWISGGDAQIHQAGGKMQGSASPRPMQAQDVTANPSHTSRVSSKRKYSDYTDQPPDKRPRNSNITWDQIQLATYALECMVEASRHYVTGIMIDSFQVSLWYFDRTGVISSVEFSFDQNPEKLALIVFALGHCDPVHAGFDPYIVPPPKAGYSKEVTLDKQTSRLHRPLKMMEGAELIVQPSDISGTSSSKDGVCYTITGNPLYAYRGIVGRGTMVYPVKENGQAENSGVAGDTLVVKLSWPVASRPMREHAFIEHIRKEVPYMQDHLPEVKFSVVLPAAKLSLPRMRIPYLPSPPAIEERDLTVLVTSRYQKLYEVRSVEEFQRVFVDFVECHYHAYEYAKVLHRDLSENNLMFLRSEDGHARGILNDWDLASKVDSAGVVPGPTSNHRTGTGPYMARDLLKASPPPHLYRHDLESFFFLLIWAATHYDLKVNERRPTIKAMQMWDSESYAINLVAKGHFISDPDSRDDILMHIREEFKSLEEPWLNPLWDLFHEIQVTLPTRKPQQLTYNWRTFNGRLTFHTFMAAISSKPRIFPSSA